MTPTRKLSLTISLFAAGLLLVFLASAVDSVLPLFLAWIPLLAVPWVLTRPEAEAPLEPSEDEPAR